MTDLLKTLYFTVQSTVPASLWDTPEHRKSIQKSIELNQRLKQRLNEEEWSLYQEARDLYIDIHTIEQQAFFLWVLRLGMELATA